MSIETKEMTTARTGSIIRRKIKFSEKKFLRDCTAIPNWRLDWIRNDLDPEEYNKILNFFKELYEAARAHPDWSGNGELAFCVDEDSPQNTATKLLKWYRATRGLPTTPETQNEK